jgi:site-specific DNA recombinase
MTETTPVTARAMPRARRRKGVPAGAPGTRAAIYVRLSRKTDETTSPERQRAACEALCEARGWEVVAAEEDIDVSGFSCGLDRPGLQRILTRLAELDVIVFFKIDRLARSTPFSHAVRRGYGSRQDRLRGRSARTPHHVAPAGSSRPWTATV